MKPSFSARLWLGTFAVLLPSFADACVSCTSNAVAASDLTIVLVGSLIGALTFVLFWALSPSRAIAPDNRLAGPSTKI